MTLKINQSEILRGLNSIHYPLLRPLLPSKEMSIYFFKESTQNKDLNQNVSCLERIAHLTPKWDVLGLPGFLPHRQGLCSQMGPSNWTLNPQSSESSPWEAGVLTVVEPLLTQGGLDMGGPAGGQGAGRERKAASPGSSRGVAGFVSFALSCPPYTITTMNSLTPCRFMGENMYFLKCHKHSIEEYQSPGTQPPGDSYQERLPLKSNKPALAEHTHNAILGRTPER